jgi:hypothetical protein
MANETKRAELLIRIKRALKRVPFPDRKIGIKEELQDFLGKRWQEITVEDIMGNSEFYLFNQAGFVYYLPAYLTMILKHPETDTSYIRRTLMEVLALKPIAPDLCGWFSPEQRSVILEFFVHYLDFFPFRARTDLHPHIARRVEQQQKERLAELQAAIDYWRSCVESDK